MKIIKQAQEIKQLKKELNEAYNKLTTEQVKAENLSHVVKEVKQNETITREAAKKIESERDKLKTLVKSQTEAELVMVSLKILFETLQPKKEITYQSNLSDYQAQQQAMQKQLSGLSSQYNTSIWGSLGGLSGALLGPSPY